MRARRVLLLHPRTSVVKVISMRNSQTLLQSPIHAIFRFRYERLSMPCVLCKSSLNNIPQAKNLNHIPIHTIEPRYRAVLLFANLYMTMCYDGVYE